ncbi:MAG: glycosyltransferase family 2 protein [Candidatus Bathyarchaeota archaeon]|nr:MAG: glycosyltransferase family 2 protein [Candidatus Bathyarchaeota archaeon]
MNKDRPFVVAAVPAYDEEKTIAKVVLQAQRYVDKVVVCDDGSRDLTAEIAERLGAEVIRHERSLGYGAAIQSLFRKSRELNADVMVTLDADGQHNPREIPRLLKPILKEDVDIAVGSRFLDKEGRFEDAPLYRRLGVKAITKLTSIAVNNEMSDAQHGFRAYGRKALEGLKIFENGMGASVEILMKAKEKGLRVVEISMGCNYHGLEKTSTHSPIRHGASIVMSIVKLVVEDKPLVFLGVPGAVSLLVGVLFGVWMLQIYAIEGRIVTNIALATVAFIFVGLFAVFTAITLYAIARLIQKTNKQ